MIVNKKQKTAYYIGGISVHGNKNILSFKEYSGNICWGIVEKDFPHFDRHGHLAVSYKDYLVVFGGEKGK